MNPVNPDADKNDRATRNIIFIKYPLNIYGLGYNSLLSKLSPSLFYFHSISQHNFYFVPVEKLRAFILLSYVYRHSCQNRNPFFPLPLEEGRDEGYFRRHDQEIFNRIKDL
jgi:hypothetical protein